MNYYGIVISGPKFVGKSTIAHALTERTSYFKQIQSITTRERRDGDTDIDYEFIDADEFHILDSEELLLSIKYSGVAYGIRASVLNELSGIPVFIVTPASIPDLESNLKKILKKEEKQELLTFFIDADDHDIKSRALSRDAYELTSSDFEQINCDRSFKDNAICILNNKDLDNTVNLIIELWKHRESGGMIPKRILKYGINSELFLKNADVNNISGAAYDLHLGDEYYYAGKIQRTEKNDLFIIIDPYDYAIVTSKETTNLPRNVAAKFGLSVRLFCQGVILSNGPQIDPGFRGNLFCLLFNTSNKPIVLKKGEKYATIEFNQLLTHTEAYTGKYQDKHNIIDYLPSNVMQGAVSELKKEIDDLKNQTKNLHTFFMAIIAIILSIIPLMLLFKE